MSPQHTKDYYALIESLIDDQRRIWGEQAIDIADSVAGLDVSDDDIWITGNEREIAGALADAYVERFGQAATTSLRDVAADYRDDITVPPVLRE